MFVEYGDDPPPEEAALTERGDAGREFDDLTITLPPGVDLQRLEDAALDELVEAELVAIDQGDPETAALIAAAIGFRRRAR